jgi:hypothetical protein
MFHETSFAQTEDPDYRVEIAGRLALGDVRVFGSNEQDNGLNLGGAIEFRIHRRLGIEFEGSKVMDLEASPVPCGLPTPCTGQAVEGVHAARHFSGNVLYYFLRSDSAEPYVLAGLGTLRSKSSNAVTFVGEAPPRIVQLPDESDNGLSLGFGGGVRFPIGRLSLRPDVRLYDSSLRSRANLALIQVGLLIGFRW